MTESPTVSVIVPAYNAERTILVALNSVLDGSRKDVEVIVCDDASTDATACVVESIHDGRVQLLRNSENRGEGASRNRAISRARGRWIALLDADDAYDPERLGALLRVAINHPNAVVFDEAMECHDTPHGLRSWKPVHRTGAYPGPPQKARRVSVADWIGQRRPVITPLIPTQLIRSRGLQYTDKRCSADLEFLLKVLAKPGTELWYVPRPMYLYRMVANSMSGVADRYELTASTLLDAAQLYADDSRNSDNLRTLGALRQSAAYFRRMGEYRSFLRSVKRFDLMHAVSVACRNPWMIGEFARRSVDQMPYWVSCARHGVRPRARS